MSCLLASFLSTTLGLLIYQFGRVRHVLDRFQIVLGQSVYEMNRFGRDEEELILLSQKLAVRVVKQLCLVIAAVGVLVGLASIPFWFVDFSSFSTSEMTWSILGGAVIPCVVYFALQPTIDATQYSAGKQLFFYLTLGNPTFGRLLSKLERLLFKHPERPERAIFVTGLARAGTTALLQQLHRTPELWSWNYRHMPCLMASRMWSWLNRGHARTSERIHQDGIQVGLNSPEAFDEYFWRVILEERYYTEDALHSHDVTATEVQQFEQLASAHLAPGNVYLSKNNNFLLRAESYRQHRPNDVIVLVYRDPLEHAQSLLRQHQLQSRNQVEEPFIGDYMDMLGHHEFGQHRRDFVFEDEEFEYHDKDELNYWLERWVSYYQYALQLPAENYFYVSNDMLRCVPNQVVDEILARVDVRRDCDYPPQPQSHRYAADASVSAELLQQAKSIYAELETRTFLAEPALMLS